MHRCIPVVTVLPFVLILSSTPSCAQAIFADGFESGDSCQWSESVTPDECDGGDNDCDGTIDEDANCDDSIYCTEDWCDGLTGCIHEPDDEACEDAIICTVNTCDPVLGCIWSVHASYCYIDSECFLQGANPQHPHCQLCDPASNQTSWTLLTGNTCDDNDVCTVGEQCDQGICSGGVSPCPPPDPSCPQGYTCIEIVGTYTCICI